MSLLAARDTHNCFARQITVKDIYPGWHCAPFWLRLSLSLSLSHYLSSLSHTLSLYFFLSSLSLSNVHNKEMRLNWHAWFSKRYFERKQKDQNFQNFNFIFLHNWQGTLVKLAQLDATGKRKQGNRNGNTHRKSPRRQRRQNKFCSVPKRHWERCACVIGFSSLRILSCLLCGVFEMFMNVSLSVSCVLCVSINVYK